MLPRFFYLPCLFWPSSVQSQRDCQHRWTAMKSPISAHLCKKHCVGIQSFPLTGGHGPFLGYHIPKRSTVFTNLWGSRDDKIY
ncbi:hypothetical protein B0H19DRAFT_1128618 [Mycena capillaripes]|nr:hypothetical protein B0H19DRAFT_1128618 [Mycena capillaripes]